MRILLCFALATTSLFAADKPIPSAFQKLASLVGQWEGTTSDGKKVSVSYELVSSGSALVETLKGESEPSMVSVYTPDGDRVAMTHYCSARNQPYMRTEPLTGPAQQYVFKTEKVANLTMPGEGYMTGLTVDLKDADHFTQAWTFSEKEKKMSSTELFTYTRKK